MHRGYLRMACKSEDGPKIAEISALQEMCLSVIISNFDMYHAIFKLSPASSVLRTHYYEFLARRFSGTLFYALFERRLLKPDYLDFLINPHFKHLQMSNIDFFLRLDFDFIDKLRTCGKNVLSIAAIFRSKKDISFYKPLLSVLPNLEHINFALFCDLNILEPIGRSCPSLKTLRFDIAGGYMNDKNPFHDGIYYVIEHCPHLESLRFYDSVGVFYRKHKNCFSFNSKTRLKTCKKYALKNLFSAKRKYPLRDAMEICTVLCPHVSSLCIETVDCDEDLEMISHFTLLKDLTLGGIEKISSICLKQFFELRGSKLIHLDLGNVSCLTISTIIESCPNLQTLGLVVVGSSSDNGNGEPFQTSLSDLKELRFSRADFSNQRLSVILKFICSTAKNLRVLKIPESSGLTSSFFHSLDLNNVYELDLSFSDIKQETLEILRTLLHGKLKKLGILGLTHDDYILLTKGIPDDRTINCRYRGSYLEF